VPQIYQSKSDLKMLYGINCRSVLCNLPMFNITKQLPQDVMHIVLEDVLQYEVRLVLLYYLQHCVFSLAQFNHAILHQNYGYSEISDKPCALRDSFF